MTHAFWILLSIVAYVYAGYPLLLMLLARLGARRPWQRADVQPQATLVISAYNEAAVIADKLRNCLALDYPRERLEVVVVSDASDDGTDDLVAGFAPEGIRLLRMPHRAGKTTGLNAAVERARGELVVFSDANALYAPDAIRMLARNFADPAVGAAVGESGYEQAVEESERQESLYWRYETAIKRLESALGSVVGGDGAIYAVRRSLYRPMAADALSDFVNPLQVVGAGFRCIYEPSARSRERAAGNFEREFRRKVRIVNRAARALARMPGMLNPLRHGRFAVQLLSHKLLRWLVPFLLAALFAVNVAISGQGPLYQAALAGQGAFYLLALLGHALRRRGVIPWIVSVPYYFCLVNAASARGLYDALRGRTYTTWATARSAGS